MLLTNVVFGTSFCRRSATPVPRLPARVRRIGLGGPQTPARPVRRGPSLFQRTMRKRSRSARNAVAGRATGHLLDLRWYDHIVQRLIGSGGSGLDHQVRPASPVRFIAVIEDLSEIKRAQAEALIDPLTGLFNRRGIIERLNQEIRIASASRTALGVLYIDLDNFKEINDQYGHSGGDECLLRVAESLTADARIESAAARIGGDEFVMILPRADRDQLAVAGVRVQSAIRKSASRRPWKISASLGGASMIPFDPISPQQFIGWADEAMFLAKRSGKDRLHISGQLS